MELIKKIKDAEHKAKEIIQKAKSDASKMVEESHQQYEKEREQAEQERKKAIQMSLEQAEAQAHTEIAGLRAEAEKHRRELREKVEPKIEGAAERVVEHIRS